MDSLHIISDLHLHPAHIFCLRIPPYIFWNMLNFLSKKPFFSSKTQPIISNITNSQISQPIQFRKMLSSVLPPPPPTPLPLWQDHYSLAHSKSLNHQVHNGQKSVEEFSLVFSHYTNTLSQEHLPRISLPLLWKKQQLDLTFCWV